MQDGVPVLTSAPSSIRFIPVVGFAWVRRADAAQAPLAAVAIAGICSAAWQCVDAEFEYVNWPDGTRV